MARTVAVKLNGHEWHMPASYKASRDLAQRVGDPLKLAIAISNGENPLDSEGVVGAIYVGCKHAGCSLSKEEIGELIFSDGVDAYLHTTIEYIVAMVTGAPETPVDGKKKPRSRG